MQVCLGNCVTLKVMGLDQEGLCYACMYQGIMAPAEPSETKRTDVITFNSTLSIGCMLMTLSTFSLSIYKAILLIC